MLPGELQSDPNGLRRNEDTRGMLVIRNFQKRMDSGIDSELSGPLKVLVIDDHQAHAEGLAELLQLAGFDADYVMTGGDGLTRAREEHVDAVLLDMNLPDMNGFEVCRRLRRDPDTMSVAVIFHTAQGSVPGARHEGDAFLTYPVAMTEVYAVIRASVERRRKRLAAFL